MRVCSLSDIVCWTALDCSPLRRSVGLVAVVAALTAAASAGATLAPVEHHGPRVRSGELVIPSHHGEGRVRMIVGLALPPLAAVHGPDFAAAERTRRLDVTAPASRRYLARIRAAQNAAEARLVRAIPEARIGRRFQIVLDGLTVSLPATKLPQLVRLPFVQTLYPSLTYKLSTDTSPGVIGADELHALTGARGDGVKIGIVDDGVDNTNPFLAPDGLAYPPGFPRGGRRWTSPKVIVARAFPGPSSGRRGRLAVDRRASFHATHVAGIAAGDSGTCTPGGADHPATCGLSGVAPRAYIGNYRVFNVPTPIGHVANTPEIAAAFEAAVRDGMDIVNFSGGGAETEPANDAMIEVVRNVAAAGVVPVISAGNDRDEFGMGTIGSPGSAPEAITVAAVSNTHVFAPVLTVQTPGAPQDVKAIPVASAGGARFPGTFAFSARELVDVGNVTDRRLCGPEDDVNNETKTPVQPGSLAGVVALVSRGHCTFASKAARARQAGAAGLILVDNRPGEANAVPLVLPLPTGMISDLDGARLRAYLATTGGRAPVTISNIIARDETGRSGVVTSFSSGGPTAFEHLLKPDLSAPGGQILSSTLSEFSGGPPFAVFDGTSMAAPHVSGAVALLLQLHPPWGPEQVKSALMSTAVPAWADTARTHEAPVTLGGAGLVDLPRATAPQLFTEPASLSFRDLDVNDGGESRALLVRVTDAGTGAGTWQVELAAQAATRGASLDVPAALTVAPGGEADLVAIARARADGETGDNYGFILLRRGSVTLRIPYEFYVERPQIELTAAKRLVRFQAGNTIRGTNRVTSYCCPAAPFGPSPDYVGPALDESGAETTYVTSIDRPVANLGVAVESSTAGSLVDPWFLGSPNERDVQGYAGTPVNVNELMADFGINLGAAGASFPKVQRFYVTVDSGSDPFTHRPLPGEYVLRSWVNDVRPPRIRLVTRRVASGRPTIVARVTDTGAGVDPLSLVIGYRTVLVGASLYDPTSGIAIFPLPAQASKFPAGRTRAVLSASDFQEAKNVSGAGDNVLPNTAFRAVSITGVSGPALSWVAPAENECVTKTVALVVVAGSSQHLRSVRFFADGKAIGLDRRGISDVYTGSWQARFAPRGRHVLTATATDAGGRTFSATRHLRVCR